MSVDEFQERRVEESADYEVLAQRRRFSERKSVEQQYLQKQLQVSYNSSDKTRNYQEFTDTSMNNQNSSREVFTSEGHLRRSVAQVDGQPDIDWSKYGVDLAEYIASDSRSSALYTDGCL